MELEYFAKGKRSLVYKIIGKNQILKKERSDSKAKDRIKNEIKWLKILNKYNIGPKLIDYGDDYFICEYVKGKTILDWMVEKNLKQIKRVLKIIFKKCYELDKLGVNKEEMHRPIKHIIIGKKIKMIDFERCFECKNPHNVTQFSHFILSKKVQIILKSKGYSLNREKLIPVLKEYKRDYSNKTFKELLNSFKL